MPHCNPDLFTWSSKYSVGIPEIDAQHKKLVSMLNDLFNSMRAGEGDAVLGSLFQSLIVYTEQHFSFEENLMRRSRYPELNVHIEEHRALTRKAHELQDKFRAGRVAISMQLTSFLKEWLQHHILGSDSAYARMINRAHPIGTMTHSNQHS